MKYSIKNTAGIAGLAFVAAISVPALAAGTNAQPTVTRMATSADYRFVLAGSPVSAGAGNSIVSIMLMDGDKKVAGAIITESRADMGPINMADMTAPITSLGEQPPGTYRFEVANGPVWKKPDNWALRFSARVQGVAQAVSGSVIVKLMP